jgi:hypothetical protein
MEDTNAEIISVQKVLVNYKCQYSTHLLYCTVLKEVLYSTRIQT